MYNNIGDKIKSVAKTVGIVGIVLSIIIGIFTYISLGVLIGGGGVIIGVAIMVGGSIASWLSTWILYSWGDIVDNVQQINETLTKLDLESKPLSSRLLQSAKSSQKIKAPAKWTCPKCGEQNNANAHYCINCFTEKP